MYDFKDRIVEGDDKFRIVQLPDGRVQLVPAPDRVVEAGSDISHGTLAKAQAVLKTHTASEPITAGTVVNVLSDEAYYDVVAQDNVETVLASTAISSTVTCKIDGGRSMAFTSSNMYDTGFNAYILDADGKVLKSSGIEGARTSNVLRLLSAEQIAPGKVFVCYIHGNPYAIYGIIVTYTSDNTIGCGKYNAFYSYAGIEYGRAIPLDETRVLIILNRTGIKALICTVNADNSIAPGSQEYALPSNTGAAYITAKKRPDGTIAICYSDTGDGNKGKAVIATVASGVTFGAVATFNSADTSYIDCDIDNGDIIAAYASANNGYAKVLPINGTIVDVTQTAALCGSTPARNIQIRKVGNRFVYSYENGWGKSLLLSRTGNTLKTSSGDYLFNNGATNSISTTPIEGDKVLQCYADAGNSNYGTSTILTVRGDKIAGSFSDSSRQAIALNSAPIGGQVACAYDGKVKLDGKVKGQRIDSPGVSAVCFEDGWLDVTAEWNKPFVTGSFTGGMDEEATINLGFRPQVVICYSASNNDSGIDNYSSTEARQHAVPRILSGAFVSPYGAITNTGFTHKFTSSGNPNTPIYYAAYR